MRGMVMCTSRIHRWLWPGLVVLVLAGLLATPTLAQSRLVVVERRDGDIHLLPSGALAFTEIWRVRFVGGPTSQLAHRIAHEHLTSIDGWQVSEGAHAYTAAENAQPGTFALHGDGKGITWHFTPTLDEVRTFRLSYTVDGALAIYPEGDQVHWPFIEADRPYPIYATHVALQLPRPFASSELGATTHFAQRATQQATIVGGAASETIVFRGGPFAPDAGWEIGARLPHGAVTASPPAWQLRQDSEAARQTSQPFYNRLALTTALLILSGGVALLALLWSRSQHGAAVAQPAECCTRPPSDLPPALSATLLDGQMGVPRIVATLLDLARRGVIQIVEQHTPAQRLPSDFRFVLLESSLSGLRPYEKAVLHNIFGSRLTHERHLSALHQRFYTALPPLKNWFYHEVVQAGYLARDPQQVHKRYARLGQVLLLLALVGALVGYPLLLLPYAPFAIAIFIALALVAGGFILLAHRLPDQPFTTRGIQEIARWQGFKHYLEHIEDYTDLAIVRDQFELYLPYAVAFGCERSLMRKFIRANAPPPAWYILAEAVGPKMPPALKLKAACRGMLHLLKQAETVLTSRPDARTPDRSPRPNPPRAYDRAEAPSVAAQEARS